MQNQGPPAPAFASHSINWVTTFFMPAFHIGGIAALFFFTWHTFFVAIVLCGYRGAWASGWAIIGCSHITGTELPSGWNIF
jgi:hypothetical protein